MKVLRQEIRQEITSVHCFIQVYSSRDASSTLCLGLGWRHDFGGHEVSCAFNKITERVSTPSSSTGLVAVIDVRWCLQKEGRQKGDQ